MRILFIAPSYKPAYVYGGPVVVVSLLAETLVQLGHEVTVYTTTANGDNELPVLPGVATLVEGVKVFYFKRITKDHTHISFGLWRHLKTTAEEFDVIHIHSWWNLLVLGTAFICKRKKIRPVLSPHGMFSNYILHTNNATTKKWMHKLFGKSLLRNTHLHVSTQPEWEESQQIIPNWKGAIIPNLVALPSLHFERSVNDIFTIGFLSRIDPKKGLDVLVCALALVSFPYRLLVAGNGEGKYVKSLQALAEASGIQQSIEWLGWKNGNEKFDFLARLDLFSLTSHSENFAIVVIESLSVGTPVLISKGVGLTSYIDEHQLGWVTDMDVKIVADKIEKAYHDSANRQRIEQTSPRIIEERFDRLHLAREYADFYTMNSSNV